MIWDRNGDKHFSSAMEAEMFLQDATRGLVRWLHECRESGQMIHFPKYRSILNDIANVTSRWIRQREGDITDLQIRLHDTRMRLEANLCPDCGARRQQKE